MTPLTYIPGVIVNKITFTNGGSLLKMSIAPEKLDTFCDALRAAKSPSGWVNLKIVDLREPHRSQRTGAVVATHALCVDTYGQENHPRPMSREEVQQKLAPAKEAAKSAEPEEDQIPF